MMLINGVREEIIPLASDNFFWLLFTKKRMFSSQQMHIALFEYQKSGLPQGDVERYPVAKLPPVLPVPDISDEPG